jgi:hypothetical protein
MRTPRNIMILDTETIGTFGSPLVHDLGYVVLSKGEIVCKKRFLVKELHVNGKWILDTSDFYQGYKKDYAKARKQEMVLNFSEILKELWSDVRKHNVSCIGAYNLQFDIKAIKYSEEFFCHSQKTISKIEKKKLLCLWNLACNTVGQTAQFVQWAYENDCISSKGNISTSAETMYRYITNDVAYVECHTALNNALDESEIFKYIKRHFKGS